MANQADLDSTYMGHAFGQAKLSRSKRSKVGAVLVTSYGIIIPGYNGTPAGTSNEMEDVLEDGTLVTKPNVLHAELNCILKAAKQGVSINGATVYVTLSPCVQCSAMMIQAGIRRLVYSQEYRITDGIQLLTSSGVILDKHKGEFNE